MIEFVTQYPLFIGRILLIVMLSGIFLGFFFRRHAAEQSAKEILATPQFEQAAEAEKRRGRRATGIRSSRRRPRSASNVIPRFKEASSGSW